MDENIIPISESIKEIYYYLRTCHPFRVCRDSDEDGKYYCNKCSKNGYKEYISFEKWCIENNHQDILDRWDYSLNVDKEGNIINPSKISYTSVGFNKKGFWFKCLEHPEHKSELKNIKSFYYGQMGSMDCIQCNMIAVTHPELIKYLVNKKDGLKYSAGSHKKVLMKCPDCGYEKLVIFNTLLNQGFGSNKCGDGYSYPNKIIEVHGIQHYEEICRGKSLIEEKWNDKYKERMAKIHGIKDNDYIVIDSRESEIEWIKNNILNSKLSDIYNFENINWVQCEKFARTSLVKTVSDLWDSGIENIKEIADKLQINRFTVQRYLKLGAKLKWCNYNAKQESEKRADLLSKQQSKKVICLTTGKIFDSMAEARIEYGTGINGISCCCRGIQKTSGIYSLTGELLTWAYYNEKLNSVS